MPSLRMQIPGHPASVYHLYKTISSIGSGRDNDIVLPDPLVADAFASIHFDGQTYTITTLQRKHDVIINGKKRSKHVLRHDDRLVIGSCELRFALVDDAAVVDDAVPTTRSALDAYNKLHDF